MPEARIRVAALHLAGARALPLLCLGIGGGLQSRLVHHARSALKQQKSSSAPRAAPANASLRLPSSQQLALRQVASKSRSTHRRRRQKRRTNPCKYSIRYRTRQKISVYGQTLASVEGHPRIDHLCAVQRRRESMTIPHDEITPEQLTEIADKVRVLERSGIITATVEIGGLLQSAFERTGHHAYLA